jgi:hypothetical protein
MFGRKTVAKIIAPLTSMKDELAALQQTLEEEHISLVELVAKNRVESSMASYYYRKLCDFLGE